MRLCKALTESFSQCVSVGLQCYLLIISIFPECTIGITTIGNWYKLNNGPLTCGVRVVIEENQSGDTLQCHLHPLPIRFPFLLYYTIPKQRELIEWYHYHKTKMLKVMISTKYSLSFWPVQKLGGSWELLQVIINFRKVAISTVIFISDMGLESIDIA